MRFKKTILVSLLFLCTIPLYQAEAGIFFRQGRGLFPNARGVFGRAEDRQSRRHTRRACRRSGYGFYGHSYTTCSNCNKTRAKAVLVS